MKTKSQNHSNSQQSWRYWHCANWLWSSACGYDLAHVRNIWPWNVNASLKRIKDIHACRTWWDDGFLRRSFFVYLYSAWHCSTNYWMTPYKALRKPKLNLAYKIFLTYLTYVFQLNLAFKTITTKKSLAPQMGSPLSSFLTEEVMQDFRT